MSSDLAYFAQEADQLRAAIAEKRREIEATPVSSLSPQGLLERSQALNWLAAATATLMSLDDWIKTLGERAELPSANKARSMSDMAQTQSPPERRRRGRPLINRHPFPVALEARGETVVDWADAHGVKRETVKSWYSPPPTARSIPRKWADVIERELNVPATRRVWKNGIQD